MRVHTVDQGRSVHGLRLVDPHQHGDVIQTVGDQAHHLSGHLLRLEHLLGLVGENPDSASISRW